MSEHVILDVLEDIRKTSRNMEIALKSIEGDNKLQSQALKFHIEQLTAFKVDVDRRLVDLDTRVKKLEHWQIKIASIVAGATALATLLFNDIKDAFLR